MGNALLEQVLAGMAGREALLIAGPTASGKSALAIGAAQQLNGVVVNADSMQIYDGLRILTARPTPHEERQAEHRLYGVVDPKIAFSAGDYVRLAAPVLAELKTAGRPAIITGGTGLYFNALTQGLVETPEIPPHVVSQVAQLESQVDLHAWLLERDPARAAELNPADRPRLQRAAAVWLATGRSMKDWQGAQHSPLLAAGSWQGVFLEADRQALYARIDARFRTMIAEGALEEVRAIMTLGLPANRGIMKAHGMPHLVRHLAGEIGLDEAIAKGQQDTRNYARRQAVWSRRYMADWMRIAV
ncbi:MAG: tRNA (adenosine(37)-N6)-dimethylallyltransferase MiaA [Beijerinckiaceae bacterium]